MAKRGNIFYTDKDFTDLEIQQEFGFPVIVILHDNNSVIKKISAFDENGAKSIYDFSLAASKDFVTQSITTAISNIKDNTLEYPTFADFPQPGEVGNVYIDLAEDKIYIWDSASSTYISQSWNQTIIIGIQTQITALQNSKLDKGSFVGTAQDLYDRFEGKIDAGYNSIPKVGNGASGKVLTNSVVSEIYGKVGINLPSEASEKLEVGGNIKAIDFKGNSVKFNLQASITPTPNTLVPKTDGSGLIWHNNSSIAFDLLILPSSSSYFGINGTSAYKKNIYFGVNSQTTANIGGTDNVSVGYEALKNNSGFANIGIGTQVLKSATASDNIGIGFTALANLTSGGSNIAIGTSSMGNLTVGSDNVAIGRSMRNNNGSNNIAIGNGVLNSAVNNCIGIGSQSLSNTTGNFNTAIGYLSGKGILSGTYNTLLGSSAGINITTGASNVSIGADSLIGVTTGYNNTAIGSASLLSYSGNTNSYNVGVGMFTGYGLIGSYNVFLGSYAGNEDGTFNKRIVIGDKTTKIGSTIDDYPISVNMEASVPYGKHNYKNLPLRFQLPNLTKTQRDALVSKTVGEMIWQTDSGNSGIRVYDGTNWLALQTTID